ncbi:FAD-dependent oxidoreductase [Halapricum hydrolyticum]|uniref:FAD-dependent oxidoreductase n=1 Tax=Halapricum hydrolyticum TaxID=2979991 RepID=A0AAE3IB03_9EURY|nr:FAD-dependent oxidoreductase [Halapricum hydrolyticum]MCU4717665.1 FAD-dependent oxidoreductase [Halapricum hydrolyticum]MCU4726806.1 FAD-dependent oxidoreductase [Halapricum hydrolyticum]
MSETPNYDSEYDAIVVGAGLAGSTAALTMARDGLDVIMIERGPSPGTKNVFGGVLYTPRIRELTDFDDAPKERYVAKKTYSMLSEEGDETSMSIAPSSWREEPHNNSWMVLRADFDEWFAEQAVEAGAMLVTETTVTDLIKENGEVVGVETDRPDGELRAPMVVLAEGANSLVSEAAGLKDRDDRDNVAVSVKEVRKYDREKLEDRFHIDGDAGLAAHYFGDGACGDAVGGGFLYTNKRTVSIGVVYSIEDAAHDKKTPDEVLEEFKQHPAVAPLVRGGRMVEYSAHAIPEGGPDSMPELVHDGAVIVGDAAGLVLNSGVHLEGTNMAVESGYHAGRAVADALAQGRTDEAALASYETNLRDSYVVENLEHYGWFMDTAAEEKEFLFDDLPRALGRAGDAYFKMDNTPKDEHVSEAKSHILDATGGWLGAAKKAWKFRKMLS